MPEEIRLTDVTIGEEEVAAVARVLRSGWLTMGPEVEAFESEFAAAVGSRHAVAVSSGTAALRLAYQAAGLSTGDTFALPALTFVATLSAGAVLGAKPLLIDCASEDDLTISAGDLARKLSPNIKLIVTMPYGGFAPDMEMITGLVARRGNAAIVEDACHAPLASVGGRALGTFGKCGCFSFFSNKNMATGEGGMIVTDDEAIAANLRGWRSHGMTTVTWDRERGHAADYDVLNIASNDRMDEIRAAVGREQIKKLPAANAARARAASLLRERIAALNIDGLKIPFSAPRGEPAHHLFVILLPPGTNRAAFRAKMREAGIQTSVHYPPLHRFAATAHLFPEGPDAVEAQLPVLASIHNRLVTLPLSPLLDEEKIGRIAAAIRASLA